MTREHTELVIWKLAHELTLELYRETVQFPKNEQFGLALQIRRASSSIGANIAEGCGQITNKAFKRFLFISFGSIKELENHLVLAKDLNYLSLENYTLFSQKAKILGKMLNSFIHNIPSS